MTTKDLQEKVKDKELIIEVRIFETPEAEKLLVKYYFQHSLFYTLKDQKI